MTDFVLYRCVLSRPSWRGIGRFRIPTTSRFILYVWRNPHTVELELVGRSFGNVDGALGNNRPFDLEFEGMLFTTNWLAKRYLDSLQWQPFRDASFLRELSASEHIANYNGIAKRFNLPSLDQTIAHWQVYSEFDHPADFNFELKRRQQAGLLTGSFILAGWASFMTLLITLKLT